MTATAVAEVAVAATATATLAEMEAAVRCGRGGGVDGLGLHGGGALEPLQVV